MRILQYQEDQKALRTPGKLVTKEMIEPPEFQNNLQEMYKILEEQGDGIGLAATQVGWSIQLFILTIDEELNKTKPQVFLNPKVRFRAKKEVKEIESCLSFRGRDEPLQLKISRPVSILWEYETLEGLTKHVESKDFYARVILHEHDHIVGKLFVDSASTTERLKFSQWLKRNFGRINI